MQISPLDSALTDTPPVTPLEYALTKTRGRGVPQHLCVSGVQIPVSSLPDTFISYALSRLRILPVATGVCPPRPLCSALRALCVTLFPSFERSSTLTPLPLITSLQPQQFHTITHSFAQRESTISSVLNTFRTLLMSIGGGTPQLALRRVCFKRGRRYSFPCAGRKTVHRSAPQPPQLPMRPLPHPAAARARSGPNGIRQ